MMHELICYRDYVSEEPLTFWRSTSGFEVDFILGDHTAIEVKAKKNVGENDLRSLRALTEEKRFKKVVCASLEPRRRSAYGIAILPWKDFLEELWSGEYR